MKLLIHSQTSTVVSLSQWWKIQLTSPFRCFNTMSMSLLTRWIYIYNIVMTILLSRYNEVVVIDYIHSPSMPPYRKVWKGTYIIATICVAQILYCLSTWDKVKHNMLCDLIGAGNGSPPVRWQPITWNHAALLSNGRNVEELHNNKFDQLISIS